MALSLFLLALCLLSGFSVQASISGRIVGGEIAEVNEFPWHVSLRVPGGHICSGSLVSLQHVLTAAHCVSGINITELNVVAGSNSLVSGGVTRGVRTIHIHSQYSSPEPAYHVQDVAVLVLSEAVVESESVRSIALAIEDVPVGAVAVTSGWGRTLPESGVLPTDLQKLNTTILNQTVCQTQWGNTSINVDHLCGAQTSSSGVCNGDSGGALVYNNQVVGIVSWANPCGWGYPDVYTRVYYYLYWIGWYVHNTELETPTVEESTSHQPSLRDANHAITIFFACFAVRKFLSAQ